MASNETQNFHLNQWSLPDDVRMEDFNADNLKLEQALSGMLRCQSGSYVGDGTYDEAHAITLQFDLDPQIVIVSNLSEFTTDGIIALRGTNTGIYLNFGTSGVYRVNVPVTWGTNSLTWYSPAAPHVHANTEGTVYRYFALGSPAPGAQA